MEYIILVVCIIAAVSCYLLYSQRTKKFDSGWLVDLAEEQYPEDIELHNALRNCKTIKGNHFVSPKNPNQPGAEWQFDKSITLQHPEMNDIVIDILKDGRVGSIEYLGLMCQEKA